MPKEDTKLVDAKQAYRNASAQGNRQEEARWANVVGDILKNRGEYVEALKWLRLDYDISVKYLPEKQVLPSCQSLGEVYLRLQDFSNALVYQKKHLDLAKVSNDRVEQQRAYTQLGRTYHEIFLKSENDHSSIHNARKYFKKAMSLAQSLREKQGSGKSFFLKEYIDAHNNMGMLEMDLDNLEEARNILTEGMKICEDDEVNGDDDGRSRLHHNLGNVYTELRRWDEAREHIEKDIMICKRIEHHQGEAKGYINLGELHYRVQRYQEALLCYEKALILAKSMEDEDALADQIKQNIETVKEAIKVMNDIKQEEQNLKKLSRKMAAEKGTPGERNCLLKQNDSLDRLIEKSSIILAWQRHLEFAKKKKRVATEICDKEKLSDAYLVIGESYQKLRIYIKALKWYFKSWGIYKSIGNLEGQALVKINIGNVMDSDGDCKGALNAFEEGHRIAVEARLSTVQLLALENMHYSYMIRFDNVEEASKLQLQIDKLKRARIHNPEPQNSAGNRCSETDSEGNIESTPKSHTSPKSLSRSTISNSGRKRIRVILSDDEDDLKIAKATEEDVATSDEFKRTCNASPGRIDKTDTHVATKCAASPFMHSSLEESTCSHASKSPRAPARSCSGHYFRSSSIVEFDNGSNMAASAFKCKDEFSSLHKSDALPHKSTESDVEHAEHMTFKIDKDMIHIEADSIVIGDTLSIESLKVHVACSYYLQLPEEKRSKGLLPIIQSLRCGGTPLESLEATEALKNSLRKGWVEVLVDGWVQKRLMKLYVDCCQELSEIPNMKVLMKLYNLEVSEDEVIVSECDLQDLSVIPLLNALHAYKTVATLDLAHNVLGNGTMEKLQNVFSLSGKAYGGLSLDLHCNRFGPTSLFQICQCSKLLLRLEVLNLSGNRLTDACGSYLITILKECKSLYSLNIEQCSLTSRTIQKVADELDDCSSLSQISLGHNTISGNSLASLLTKLASLKRLSELNLKGLKLSKLVVENLYKLIRSSCLPALMIGNTNIGNDGALRLIESFSGGHQELLKLDWSYCRLTPKCIVRLNCDSLICQIAELNLNGNPIKQEGVDALISMLSNVQCSLRVLSLNNCGVGFSGILGIIKALADNDSLEELYVAENAVPHETLIAGTREKSIESLTAEDTASTTCARKEILANEQSPCAFYADCELEVADSEEDEDRTRKEPGSTDDCRTSSFLDNQFIQNLSSAIGKGIHLRLLDLSGNGFSEHMAETLYYSGWLSARDGVAQRHITARTLHLLVHGVKCCGLRPCCRKDTLF